VSDPKLQSVSEFDESCRVHDIAIAKSKTNEDLRRADEEFYNSNINKGVVRSTAAYLVKYINPIMTNKGSKKSNLRGSVKKNTVPTMQKNDAVRAAPVAFATRRSGSAPKMTTTSTGVTVSHRSFLKPVINSLNFDVQALPCNPGMSGSFPWLCKLARRYEEYRFKKLRYEFRSVAASSESGVIMMSFDYDAADAAPATKAEQAQTIPNTETNVWMNNDLVVTPEPKWLYVRSGNLSSNLDIKTYDMGNLWLSSAYGNNVTGGELYVEYTVELRKPTDGPEVCGVWTADTGAFSAPVNQTNASSTGPSFPFRRFDNTTFDVISGGEYLVVCRALGTGLTATIPSPTFITGGTTSAALSLHTCVNATSTLHVLKIRVDTGDQIVFANAGTGTTITQTRYYVAPIDYTSF